MKTILLTLGRLPKALDLARGFAANGCRVLVAEPFRFHVTGASRAVARSFIVPAPRDDREAYLRALLAIIASEKVDLVVPVSEETVHVAHLRDRLPPDCGLFTMPPDAVLALHDKYRFIAIARAAGLAVPETYRADEAAARDMAARQRTVLKPIFSCSGRGVRRLSAGAAIPAAQADSAHLVQSFLPGEIFSSCSLAFAGLSHSNVIYRGKMMSGSVAVSFERVIHPAISDWIDRFVAASHWTGFISFDFMTDAAGVAHAIECNPRGTSGLHFWQAEDIACAILAGGGAPRFRRETELQQFYSCLTETQASMFAKNGFREKLKLLLTIRDVTWDRRDPIPFLTMSFTSWKIIALAAKHRCNFGEVATLDVGWYEAPQSPARVPDGSA